MSAFMVSKKHIDLLITVANDGPREAGIVAWSYRPGKDLGGPDRLGELLIGENLKSVHYRYPDCVDDPDRTPGPVDRYWERPYTFEKRDRPPIVEALKLVDGYEYQACEHPEWKSSAAREFCHELRKWLTHFLPGWGDAPWCP